jgi:hypothetical protein
MERGSAVLVTFSNCHFNTFEQEPSRATFSMVYCFADGNEFLGLPEICSTQTALVRKSSLGTGAFTQPLQVLFRDRKMLIVTVVANPRWR